MAWTEEDKRKRQIALDEAETKEDWRAYHEIHWGETIEERTKRLIRAQQARET